MIASGAIAVAYETVQLPSGELPLLTPMSEVAGRMAVQEGAKYLEKVFGGSGVLLGGVPGVAPGEVVIIGGGVVGINAAKMAAGLGAHVTILDISLDRLRYLDDVLPANVDTTYSNRHNILERHPPGRPGRSGRCCFPAPRRPTWSSGPTSRRMKPGSVIVDVAVDQGGCVETIKPTTHENPTYFVDGILHYAVANMPGGVPRTSTLALTNATLPYGLKLAKHGWRARLQGRSGIGPRAQRGRGQGGLPGCCRGLPAPADRRRLGPVTEVLITRLPHAEGLPLPALATPGRRRVRRRERGGRGPRPDGAQALPDRLRDRGARRGSSARSGPAPGWRCATASRCPTPRRRSTATTGAS